MPPDIYTQVLNHMHAILKKHYNLVGSPIEAPGKQTYGDVDVLVFDPKPASPLHGISFPPDLGRKIAVLLGARQHLKEKGNPTMNFLVAWPGEDVKYIQIDVKVCDSEKMLQWELFHGAHGDLWNILGSTIRSFGLTVNNLGMYLRIPEIELADRKKSMVFLTDDHGRILDFLGVDKEKWWREFGSREEMFEYAAGCRMFWIKDGDDAGGQEGGQAGRKKLKHNDRARMAKRPVFREWMDDFIPKCRAENRYTGGSSLSREQIRDEAFTEFGPAVQTTYETRLREWKLAEHTDTVWRDAIKASIPKEDVDPPFRAAVVKTVKGVVMLGEDFEGKKVPEVSRNEEVSDVEFNSDQTLTDILLFRASGMWKRYEPGSCRTGRQLARLD